MRNKLLLLGALILICSSARTPTQAQRSFPGSNSGGTSAGLTMHAGTATLAAGTITVSDTSLTAKSIIFATNKGSNTGLLSVTSQTSGVGFTVQSSNSSDASVIGYLVVEGP